MSDAPEVKRYRYGMYGGRLGLWLIGSLEDLTAEWEEEYVKASVLVTERQARVKAEGNRDNAVATAKMRYQFLANDKRRIAELEKQLVKVRDELISESAMHEYTKTCLEGKVDENARLKKGYRIQKDGTAWCATGLDFVDLQKSDAGFGDSPSEALSELLKSERRSG